MKQNIYGGLLVAFDGPNGVGKSTLIEQVQKELLHHGFDVYTTKEPTETSLGTFVRNIAEKLNGESLACLVAADRYQHLTEEIIPQLKKNKIVITDRYILSSLILQCMDKVDAEYVLAINENVIMPDVQIAVSAKIETMQERLNMRQERTRFEQGNRSVEELYYMKNGEEILLQMGISTLLNMDNTNNLENSTNHIISSILEVMK